MCVKVNICCSLWAQINMMLANLYKKAGQERSAVTSYKEVLRQCPLALDAIIGKHDAARLPQTPNRPVQYAIWFSAFRSPFALGQRR